MEKGQMEERFLVILKISRIFTKNMLMRMDFCTLRSSMRAHSDQNFDILIII